MHEKRILKEERISHHSTRTRERVKMSDSKQDNVDQQVDPQSPEHSLGVRKGQRILGHEVTGQHYDNVNIQTGQEISRKDSEDVHRNLDAQDRLIEEAKRLRLTGYGFRTPENARLEYNKDETMTAQNAQFGYDRIIPMFNKMKQVMPERCGLFEVPYGRYDAKTERMYSDKSIKALYVKKEGMAYAQIGKEAMPYGQPVIAHEFIEDALYGLQEEHHNEWEIVPDMTYDDKKGYRRYWAVLSKRLDREIKGSFRIGDVVRIGALVRNGIAEATSVGFDLFTYCVTCQNGSVGRSKELGSEAWRHVGNVEKLKEKILDGLKNRFEIGEEFLQIYEASNEITMTNEMIKKIWNRTGIANKYFAEAENKNHIPYFNFIEEKGKTKGKPKIETIELNKDITLWEGYNALTAGVWHSDDVSFSKKSVLLRNLNDELVAIVRPNR